MKYKQKSNFSTYIWFIFPALFLETIISFYPSCLTLFYSFTNESLRSPQKDFVGIKNYLSVLNDQYFLDSIWRTAIFVIAAIILRLVIGGALAFLLSINIKGRSIPRIAILIPWVLSEVVAGAIWIWVLNDQSGILNYLLISIGVQGQHWLSNSSLAMTSVIIVSLWKNLAFSFLLLFSAIQSIPRELYDACKVDGANVWQTLKWVTFPLLKSAIMINIIMVTISCFNQFSLAYTLTKGGPLRATEFTGLYLHKSFFEYGDIGIGSAISMVIFMINMTMTILYYRSLKSESLY